MRLLHLTAGAAGMYCGSCLRDNALAAALRKRGHDVVLAPLYTPTNPDTLNVSTSRVFFGAISVYLEQHVPVFRHTPAFLDRVWDSAPAIRLAVKRQVAIDPARLGAMTVSMLRGVDGFQRKEAAKLIAWLRREPRFDSITLPNSLLIGLARPLRDAFDTPIVCVLQGEDVFLDGLGEPWRTESLELIRRSVDDVDVFVAVSDYYREFMAKYLNIAPDKLRTVRLGVDLDGWESRRHYRSSPPYTIGYFARIAPEKGLHVLAEAYRRLRVRSDVPPTRLLAGGYLLHQHRSYLDDITRRFSEWGLADQFHYAGAPDRRGKIACFEQMDVFSAPTTCAESKGLPVLEAMACGVPVVQPRRGAFPEMVNRAGGGLLVQADDPDALAEGLYELIVNPSRAEELGRAGAAGVRRHYTVEHMAAEAEQVYRAC